MNNPLRALGLIEVIGYPAAVEAADAALKAADVTLGTIAKVGSGIITVLLFGDVGAIEAAVASAIESAVRVSQLRAHHVIPRVSDEVFELFLPSQVQNRVSKEETPSVIEEDLTEAIENFDTNEQEEKKEKTDVFIYEELKKKSNSELKGIIHKLNIDISDNPDYKYMKKENLIQIILESNKDKEGES